MSDRFLEVFIFALRREQTSRLAQLPWDLIEYYLRPMLTLIHLDHLNALFKRRSVTTVFFGITTVELADVQFYLDNNPRVIEAALSHIGVLYCQKAVTKYQASKFVEELVVKHMPILTRGTLIELICVLMSCDSMLFARIVNMNIPCLETVDYMYFFYKTISWANIECCQAMLPLIDLASAIDPAMFVRSELQVFTFTHSFAYMITVGVGHSQKFLDWMAKDTRMFDYINMYNVADDIRDEINAEIAGNRFVVNMDNVNHLYQLGKLQFSRNDVD